MFSEVPLMQPYWTALAEPSDEKIHTTWFFTPHGLTLSPPHTWNVGSTVGQYQRKSRSRCRQGLKLCGDMNSWVGMSFGFNVLTYFVNKNNHSWKQVTEKPHLVLSFSPFSDRQHNPVHKVPKSKSAVLIPWVLNWNGVPDEGLPVFFNGPVDCAIDLSGLLWPG